MRGKERERGREEMQQLREKWEQEEQLREARHCEEVRVVRDEGEREKREAVRKEQEKCHSEIGEIRIHELHETSLIHTFSSSLTAV